MASRQPISRQSNAKVRLLDQQIELQKPLIERNHQKKLSHHRRSLLKKNSDAETCATTSTNEEKLATARKESRQPSLTAKQLEKRQQERLRDALDNELNALDLPKLEDQVKRIPRKAKNLDWVPDSIVITNRRDYDDDDESDNCSLISGLTLPQEITLLRQIAEKHYHNHQQHQHHAQQKKKQEHNRKPKMSSSSHNKISSSSSSSRKTRNKVASSRVSSKPSDIGTTTTSSSPASTLKRRQSRPTTDAGDLKPDRAQNMEIEIKMNGNLILTGCYSGALSQSVPRRPNGAGIIKFDNGDMYMGDMKDGQMHGHGTLVNGDTVLRGEFEHNMFVV